VKCTCHSHSGFLTEVGYAEVAQRETDLYGVDGMAPLRYVDSRVSVSGLELERDLYVMEDKMIDEQARRFLHGTS